ncbi:MAG: 2-oxoacid:acceptor oxidoreductase subunit alpha [bacterium]|nr:2-oxoacid:acceptor oxidoreductase subunit alpha [bacterium]
MPIKAVTTKSKQLDHVIIRFVGDSGDGMQLTGGEFTKAAAISGNDISTLAEFPAEIRAPAGTLAGVSGFQLQFSSQDIFTPGDAPDVLVAMNPAALKANINDLVTGGILILNQSSFTTINLKKAGYTDNPIENDALKSYRVIAIDMNTLVQRALESENLSVREVARCKNFWALGLMYWIYQRDPKMQIKWIEQKFANKKDFMASNVIAFKAGYAYGENTEIFQETINVPKVKNLAKEKYRSITGNSALSLGLIAAANKSGLNLFLGSYPITPASDILHELAKYRNYNVTTFQAEDEIAAMSSAVGAAYGGALAAVTTSGPGFVLKAESLGLGLMYELPMIVIDVQRAGPSTGMPTKPEQSDLLLAMYGRSGESPLPIIAPLSPSDCFSAVYEAAAVAIKYMCPVIVLSDAFIANSAEPWKIPEVKQLKAIPVKFRTDPNNFNAYERNAKTLARDWVLPGTPGLEHRIGGLEKHKISGDVSYDPQNHEDMVKLREDKISSIAPNLPQDPFYGKDKGDLLVIGWGGTYGAIHQAVINAEEQGKKVSHLHLRWLNPLPHNLDTIMKKFKQVLICELNTGQLWKLLRAQYLIPALKLNKVQGKPFFVKEITAGIEEALKNIK